MIPATVAFRVRNHLNSQILLEHGEAGDLPAIPGRGIVQTGLWEKTIQVPYVDKDHVKAVVGYITKQMDYETLIERTEELNERERVKWQQRKVGNREVG